MSDAVDDKRRKLLRALRDRREQAPTLSREASPSSSPQTQSDSENLQGRGRMLELLQRRFAEGPAAAHRGRGGMLLRALAQSAGGADRRVPLQRLGQTVRQMQGIGTRPEGARGRAFAAPADLREAFGPADLRTAAREAWTFCLPLIEVARLRMLAAVRAQRAGNGINCFNHTRELVTPGMRVITTPNVDTLFSNAFI